jgi:putative ABC transport system permease protein
MSSLLQDIRFGIRMLFKNTYVTIFAILALSIGIGANTALFSLVYGVLFSPLPFNEPENLLWIQTHWKATGGQGSCSGPDFNDWKEHNTSFENLCAINPGTKYSLTGVDTPIGLEGFRCTVNFLETLKETPLLGRGFRPEDAQEGNHRVVILSHRIWSNVFDADPDIIDKIITIDEEPYTVIGVMRPIMGFIEEMAQIYTPITEESLLNGRGSHYLGVMGRLKPGITIENAQAELNVIAAQLEQQYIESNKNKGVIVHPLHETLVEEIRPVFLILYGAVGFLLLIACVNVANLLLAKSNSRSREIAIRCALGAGRIRIFRQVLTESVILSLVSGALGLLLGFWSLNGLQLISPRLLNTAGGSSIPGMDEIRLDLTVLLFTIGISMITGLLFGIFPAWHASKSKINEALKEGGRGTSSGASHHRILNVLVVSQVALALILLVGSGLLINSFYRLHNTNPGFESKNLLAIHMERTRSGSKGDDNNVVAFFNDMIDRYKAIPGVQTAAAINIHPLTPHNSNNGFTVENRPMEPGEYYSAENRVITPDYFQTIKIPLIQGRYFDVQDNDDSKKVIIVNQEFTKRIFPNEDALGKRIHLNGNLVEIVGIVGNIKFRSLSAENYKPFMYRPIEQVPRREMTFVIRTENDPNQLANVARQEIWNIDPNQPILWIKTMDRIVGDSISIERFSMILLTVIAVIALLLAVIGIYGVMLYSVNERTNEIGVRMALGAQVSDILTLIVCKGITLTIFGVIIGLAGSIYLMKFLSSMLYEISSVDITTFAATSLLLILVAFLACFIPARKAAQVDPMITLRCE